LDGVGSDFVPRPNRLAIDSFRDSRGPTSLLAVRFTFLFARTGMELVGAFGDAFRVALSEAASERLAPTTTTESSQGRSGGWVAHTNE